jgi:hypothetical protein
VVVVDHACVMITNWQIANIRTPAVRTAATADPHSSLPSNANAVAHALAGETFLASPVICYHIPYCIETIIINEMQKTIVCYEKHSK